ncbi:MAG: hypothetical protein QM739_08480 [Propionivibrio sp.]
MLFIGNQFRQAIRLYYEHSPGTVKRYPMSLNDLLLDNRYLGVERRLRRIYRDPMTGKAQWGLVKAPDGGIMGVHSLSSKRAIKAAGFSLQDAELEGKGEYKDWRFVYHRLAPVDEPAK